MLQGLGCNTAKYVLTVLMDLFQHAIIKVPQQNEGYEVKSTLLRTFH